MNLCIGEKEIRDEEKKRKDKKKRRDKKIINRNDNCTWINSKQKTENNN